MVLPDSHPLRPSSFPCCTTHAANRTLINHWAAAALRRHCKTVDQGTPRRLPNLPLTDTCATPFASAVRHTDVLPRCVVGLLLHCYGVHACTQDGIIQAAGLQPRQRNESVRACACPAMSLCVQMLSSVGLCLDFHCWRCAVAPCTSPLTDIRRAKRTLIDVCCCILTRYATLCPDVMLTTRLQACHSDSQRRLLCRMSIFHTLAQGLLLVVRTGHLA